MRIAIVGTVGIGKTTIINKVKKIADSIEMDIGINIEEEKYPYLELAYGDMKKWAWIMQTDFLMLRLRSLYLKSNKSEHIIYDRSYIDDYIYAKRSFDNSEMTNEEFEIYKKQFHSFANLVKDTNVNYDLMVILTRPEKDTASIRREKRDRFTEKELTHFEEIDEMYEASWFLDHAERYVTKVIRVLAVNPEQAAKEIIKLISN